MHRALFSMGPATTETVTALCVQDRLTYDRAVHFHPPAFGSFVFGELEYRATVVHQGYRFFMLFRVVRREKNHPTMG